MLREGKSRVHAYSEICKHGDLALVEAEASYIVVVMALVVVSALGEDEQIILSQPRKLKLGKIFEPIVYRQAHLVILELIEKFAVIEQTAHIAASVGVDVDCSLLIDRGAEIHQILLICLERVSEVHYHNARKSGIMRVRDAREIVLIDVYGLGICADLCKFLIATEIYLAAARLLDQIYAFKERRARAIPIGRSFVASAVVGHSVAIVLQLDKRLLKRAIKSLLVLFKKQKYRHYVRDYPRIPVVRNSLAVAHPPIVRVCKIRLAYADFKLVLDALDDLGAILLERLAKQRDYQRELLCRLACAQVDIRLSYVVEIVRYLVLPMRTARPRGLLADGKESVDDLRQEASLVLDKLCQSEGKQAVAALKTGLLASAASASYELHYLGCRRYGPIVIYKFLCLLHVSALGKALPELSVADGREHFCIKLVFIKRMLSQKSFKHIKSPSNIK